MTFFVRFSVGDPMMSSRMLLVQSSMIILSLSTLSMAVFEVGVAAISQILVLPDEPLSAAHTQNLLSC